MGKCKYLGTFLIRNVGNVPKLIFEKLIQKLIDFELFYFKKFIK